MRIRNLTQFILLLSAALLSAQSAVSQTAGATTHKPHPEIALAYSFVNSNAPPGGCGCFHQNGGSGSFAWPLGTGKFALVGDVGVTHANPVSSAEYDLTLSTFTAGVRYSPRLGHTPFRIYGQALAGLAHAGGSLVSGSNPGAANAGAAFAGIAGGGIDLRASRHFTIRLAEADYLATTFKNGTNGHQNNLRLSAGIVFAF